MIIDITKLLSPQEQYAALLSALQSFPLDTIQLVTLEYDGEQKECHAVRFDKNSIMLSEPISSFTRPAHSFYTLTPNRRRFMNVQFDDVLDGRGMDKATGYLTRKTRS